ncbi:MAG TPA: carbohydrate ABC transporter permease [Aggregatilinea sp.]|jgi:raffinose/stachyose/melibiose transport system permease protein|uniref:carbohydrate ABC transporter permease n=1 Tax=Aggregatilinea sp. TaxID=2806333 RepID=UPI002BFD194D|nr:carbohydrate ABC transporter permease [Aggregatilinea sp.]HML20906.1 carbohydrate ABC transporter permease [Aggregatilinea sp.]
MATTTMRLRKKAPAFLTASFWTSARLVIALIWAVPFIFMIFTSLKYQPDIFSTPAFAPPPKFAWENYTDAIERGDLTTSITNSLVIAVFKVPLGLLISSMAAFAIARLRVPYAKLILGLFVLGTMVPIQVALAPLFRIILSLGLLNTRVGVILPYIAFGIPYQVFMLYGFFVAIPRDLDEAARIDGASNLQIFLRIVLPLAKPALAALFVLDFVATWNEFAIALVILQRQSTWTVPLALQSFNTQYTSMYGPLNAAIIITILPVLAVYLLFQRYFVEGIFTGAIKG